MVANVQAGMKCVAIHDAYVQWVNKKRFSDEFVQTEDYYTYLSVL